MPISTAKSSNVDLDRTAEAPISKMLATVSDPATGVLAQRASYCFRWREKRIWPCRERIGQTDVVRDIGRPFFWPRFGVRGTYPLWGRRIGGRFAAAAASECAQVGAEHTLEETAPSVALCGVAEQVVAVHRVISGDADLSGWDILEAERACRRVGGQGEVAVRGIDELRIGDLRTRIEALSLPLRQGVGVVRRGRAPDVKGRGVQLRT